MSADTEYLKVGELRATADAMMAALIKGRIDGLIEKHGGLRAAAGAIKIDPAYLHRMQKGTKINPSPQVLRKLGIKTK
jgi:hypothetical protein